MSLHCTKPWNRYISCHPEAGCRSPVGRLRTVPLPRKTVLTTAEATVEVEDG